MKYRRTDSFFDAPGIDTNAAFTDSSGQATITSTNPFNFPIAGTYDYECRLKEQRSGFDRDLTDWQTFRFTVSSAPPTITSLGCSSSTVSLSEGVTCQPRFTGGTPSSYTWRVGGGVTSNAGQRNLSVYWTSTGTKTVSLTATNSDGDDSEPKTYQISVENEEPSVARGWPTASSPRVKASQAYTFSATASDDDGNLSSCQWYIGTSQQPSNECGNFGSYTGSKTATMSFNRASGTHTVRVVFTDSAGRSDEVSWRVTVNRPPEITLVEPTDRTLSIYEGEEIEFRVRAEDDEGNLARWKVDKVGSFLTTSIRSEGNVTDDRSFTGSFSHLFELSLGSAQGTWDITPAFADSLGESASDSWTVTVRPAPDLVLESIDGPIGSVFNDQDINFGVVLKNNGGTATKSFNVSARVTNIASGQETTFEHAGSDPTTLAKGEEISIPPGDTHGTSFTSPDLDGLDSGDYGLCAVATEIGTDAFDSNKSNNEVCKDLYILPGSTGAMPVHLGLTTTDSGRRIWSAVPWETGPDAVRETADAGNFTNEADLKNLYKRLVGELAFRKALEPQNEEAHVWFTGLMESAGSAAKLAGKIYEFCEGANTPCETAIQDTGLDSSGLLRTLPPNAFDFLEDGADFAILFGDAYYSMLVNQALDAQRAQNTLNELGRLPLGPVWRQAISEAREDVAILTTPNNWIAFAAAIEANKEDFIKFAGLAAVKGLTATAIKKHLLQKGLLFTQKAIIHAFGLKVAGGAALTGGAAGTAVAAGSAALFVASVWFATEVYLDVKESHERVGVGSLASFLNAAYYNPADTGDLREALAYANYAAYDNFYESDDTWIQGIAAFDPHKLIASMGHPALLLASLGGSIQGIKDRDEFLEFMSAEREEALEELRELISIQSAQISPASLALTAGQTRELDLEATTRSGKSASTQEFVWSSSASRVATVSGDGTVTGVGPGSATITARADGVSATADVVVEAAPVDNSCTNGVAVIDPDNNPVFNVNYFCRLASIILAGSPPYPAPAAGPLRSGSWGR